VNDYILVRKIKNQYMHVTESLFVCNASKLSEKLNLSQANLDEEESMITNLYIFKIPSNRKLHTSQILIVWALTPQVG